MSQAHDPKDPNDLNDAACDAAPAARKHTVDITCSRIVELLGEYVDGELPSEERAAMDGHINACAPCLAFLRQYRFADEGVRRCMLKRVPEEFESKLLKFLKGKCKH